ncbi:MAG: hybrid sensor histidine kinase/response regulator [Pseudomonadota bacterium]|nr:hybrid sensor histidine kinase/response regulator [Pseudomonadota bacterium]
MNTTVQEQAGAVSRPHEVDGGADDTASEAQLRDVYAGPSIGRFDPTELPQEINELLIDVAALRDVEKARDALESVVAQLRASNENLVRANAEARQMREAAEAVNRSQEAFLAMLAHELRNPLAPISMAGGLLERIADSHPLLPKVHGIIKRQVGQMTRLLNDLLDASRVRTGKVVMQKQVVILQTILDNAIEAIQPQFDAHQHTLSCHMPSAPITLFADPARLIQAFSNLLVNAAKFTPDHGRIEIEVTAGARAVTVVIRDNGQGITAEMLPIIFDMFTQGPRSLARSEGGLGIGLTVVRNLIDLHGGEVGASSAGEHQGSSFTVLLPLHQVMLADAEAGDIAAPGRSALQILLIEDSADTNDSVAMLLELEGHHVTAAMDGETALAAFESGHFDVVVSDIGLPDIDGLALITRMRAARTGRMPLMIAVSGYGDANAVRNGLTAGFDHYFIKPSDASALLAAIGQHRP